MGVDGQDAKVHQRRKRTRLMRGAVAVGLVCVLFLTAPARSDAGWAGMLVQMVSVLENLRRSSRPRRR